MRFQNKSIRLSWCRVVLRKIRVIPLAAESLGVRSMCAYVETPDVRILLDPGASLAPNRFGLPPHPREYRAMEECRRRISEAACKAEVVTISHYHFDHHTPSYQDWCYHWSSEERAQEIYGGKCVLAKSYRSMINFNQRRRGWIFSKTGGSYAERLEFADGKTFRFGGTTLTFSKPVYHGSEGTPLGWVLMVTIEHDGERVLFAPDVQGPMCESTLQLMLDAKPHLAIVGGPPLYLSGFRVQESHIQMGMRNLQKLVRRIPIVILEHHILRDQGWRAISQPVLQEASKAGHTVLTAAEFRRMENHLLEARRKQLYQLEPPTPEFKRWMKLPPQRRKLIRPPI